MCSSPTSHLLLTAPWAWPKGTRPASKTYQGRIWSALVAHSYLNWIIPQFFPGRHESLYSPSEWDFFFPWHLREANDLDADGGFRCHSREARHKKKAINKQEAGSEKRERRSAESDTTSLITDSELFAKQLPRCFGKSVLRAGRERGLLNKRPVYWHSWPICFLFTGWSEQRVSLDLLSCHHKNSLRPNLPSEIYHVRWQNKMFFFFYLCSRIKMVQRLNIYRNYMSSTASL